MAGLSRQVADESTSRGGGNLASPLVPARAPGVDSGSPPTPAALDTVSLGSCAGLRSRRSCGWPSDCGSTISFGDTLISRAISWIRAARRLAEQFPQEVREEVLDALEIAAAGEKADCAKPLKGFGTGVFELALEHRGDAYRVIYAVKLGDEIWVLHAFKKKSKTGMKTPKHELEVARGRLKRLKEILR